MGGPLSRLLADLILENKIKNKIQADQKWKYLFNLVRLVNHTFMNWQESEEKLQKFFAYLNSLYAPSNLQLSFAECCATEHCYMN